MGGRVGGRVAGAAAEPLEALPMKIDLSGKSALVTGSTSGIGRAIARGPAASGARVFVNGRKPASVAAAVSQLKKELPVADIRPASGDVSNAARGSALLQTAPSV